MSDRYLWDRSGPPDPEIQRLEELLGGYRYEAPLRVVPHKSRRWLRLVAAAVILVALSSALFSVRFRWSRDRAWSVIAVNGFATVDGAPINERDALGVGQILETDERSSVTVQVARIGEVEIGPSSTVRLLATESKRHRLSLERGSVQARVWAPPFTFSVDTPAGLASDLGCAFKLVYENDRGELHVTSGWVDFDGPSRSSLVPAGAIAELRADGPGTPYYADSSLKFRDALRVYDVKPSQAALGLVVQNARSQDAMTLLHLIHRASPADRTILFDRLTTIAPPPTGVTRERIISGDTQAVDEWRRWLGLRGAKQWWLNWKDAIPEK
jgi:hypothetical protein